MVRISRTLAASAFAVLALGVAVTAPVNTASAHERGFGLAAGLIGGIAAGALIASAAQPYHERYAPAPVYVEDEGDSYEGRCWIEQHREWGPRHEFIGWTNRRVCR